MRGANLMPSSCRAPQPDPEPAASERARTALGAVQAEIERLRGAWKHPERAFTPSPQARQRACIRRWLATATAPSGVSQGSGAGEGAYGEGVRSGAPLARADGEE
jgi:hypothetical protein